ncbi:MAG: hypothetical protein AAB385_11785 [Planctomycetota bacterium]|jgi:hypothetical protein
MPVTAKLSLLFYEKLGEQVATELVEWFNSVDATYRSDLRELNELNFARFDAKLEQRLAEFAAGLRTEFGRRLDALDAKVERRFDEFDGRFAEIDGRFAQQDARITILEARLLGRMEAMQGGIKADLVRWMFGFWTGTMIALAGVLFAVLRAQ